MADRRRSLIDACSIRFAIAKERRKQRQRRKASQPRRAAMLILGAALSVGGVSEAFDETRFLVRESRDRVEIVRQTPAGRRVLASASGVAGSSMAKLANLAPSRFLVRQSDQLDTGLFADSLLTGTNLPDSLRPAAVDPNAAFAILSREVREDFFETLPFGSLIHEKAQKYDVDPALVAAVIENESRYRPQARSPKGARGLMQLMPRTGRWMGAENLYDPEQNVDAGVRYLKYLETRFPGNQRKVIAAYNAGEGNVMRYGGIPPFRETKTYVRRVMKSYEKHSRELAALEQRALQEQEMLASAR